MKLDFSKIKVALKDVEKKYLPQHGAKWIKLLFAISVVLISVGAVGSYRVSHEQPTKLVTISSAKSSNNAALVISSTGKACLQDCSSKSVTTQSTTPTHTTSSTTTSATVPQTALNNDQLNAKCYNAQNAYDIASVQVENATQTAIQNVQALESSAGLSETVTQENQIYATANAGQSQDYTVYLSAVHAIPGCAVDFQLTPYPVLPVPSD